MPETAPFRFKHVRNGEPIAPSEVPKLPPAAMMLILRARDARSANRPVELVLHELSVGIVTACLRRLEPTITEKQVEEDEEFAETTRFYAFLIQQNPEIFPPAPAEVASDGR